MEYTSLKLTCTNCKWEKTYPREEFSEEALKHLNVRDIGILYELFECAVCGTNKVSVFHKDVIIFDIKDLKMCQLGNHPIPQPQLRATPDRLSCVYCLGENENESIVPDLSPRLINSQSCPTCNTIREQDPVNNGHRTGRTEVRLRNEDQGPYICCSLFQMYQEGSCSYRRSIRETDEIIYPTHSIECPVLYLFRDQGESLDETSSETDTNSDSQDENIQSVNADEPRMIDNNEMYLYVEKIEYKVQEIKDLLKGIKDILDQQSN